MYRKLKKRYNPADIASAMMAEVNSGQDEIYTHRRSSKNHHSLAAFITEDPDIFNEDLLTEGVTDWFKSLGGYRTLILTAALTASMGGLAMVSYDAGHHVGWQDRTKDFIKKNNLQQKDRELGRAGMIKQVKEQLDQVSPEDVAKAKAEVAAITSKSPPSSQLPAAGPEEIPNAPALSAEDEPRGPEKWRTPSEPRGPRGPKQWHTPSERPEAPLKW